MADIKNITIDGTTYDLKDAKAREDVSDLKEDFNSLPDYGYVPTAGQMMSDNVTVDAEPYSYRATPYGDREIVDGIVGGTVAFNQLAHNFENRSNVGGITITSNNNGSITVTGTATATSSAYFQNGISAKGGHVYFVHGAKAGSVTHGLKFGSTKDGGNGVLNRFNTATTMQLEYFFTTGDVINETIYPNLIDLTQAFGSSVADAIYAMEQSTAGSGVAYLKAVAPKMFAQYNPYNGGELKHVSGLSAHETVGFNQWDEEWRVGYYDSQTGEFQPYTSQVANVNPIRVFPNTDYYIYPLSVMNGARIIYRDGNNNLIGVDMHQPGSPYFTTPENCEYINFCTMSSYGATYKHDICINFSDPTRNGTYEPYVKHTYALDDGLTLMGVPKWVDGKLKFDGDVYGADGSVERRYGIVDLGTLNWTYTNTDGGVFYATFTDTPHGTLNMICPKYTTVKYADRTDKTISRYYAFQDGLNIVDSAYTDAATFKTAVSGVYLVYALKTPTTETAEPYQSVQVCPNGGTEEYVSTSIVPVGHSTRYPENSRAKLDGLPWDFSTLIAPTEKAYKATRNYTTGKLLIVNNVLYEVTANIANGGNIVPNTNVTATTLSDVIASLLEE